MRKIRRLCADHALLPKDPHDTNNVFASYGFWQVIEDTKVVCLTSISLCPNETALRTPWPKGEEESRKNRRRRRGEIKKVERVLHMDETISGASDEFLKQVSSLLATCVGCLLFALKIKVKPIYHLQ